MINDIKKEMDDIKSKINEKKQSRALLGIYYAFRI